MLGAGAVVDVVTLGGPGGLPAACFGVMSWLSGPGSDVPLGPAAALESGIEVAEVDVSAGGVVSRSGVGVDLTAAAAVDAGSAAIVVPAAALELLPAESDIDIVSGDSAAAAASLFFAASTVMIMGICGMPLTWRGVTWAAAITCSQLPIKGLPESAWKKLNCPCCMHMCMFSTNSVSAC